MFTPQQLDQISFERAVFGGYDMESVDEFLEPLIQDYETLYKENATLKSKMRILVEKLEEYRRNESSVREALMSAQRTSETMVREAEAKCLQMLNNAESTASSKAQDSSAQLSAESQRVSAAIAAEGRRLAQAKAATLQSISSLESQLESCLAQLHAIKEEAQVPVQEEVAPMEAPAPAAEAPAAPTAGDMADEIAQSLERLVGAEPEAPRSPVRPTRTESNTARFANLQFGKGYDPTK